VSARDGVVSVGGIGSAPLSGMAPWSHAMRPGSSDRVAGVVHVLPGYFETVDIPLLRGRLLDWSDIADRSAAIVSASAARVLFDDAEPLGQSFDDGRGSAWRVVGVVADVRQSFRGDDRPSTYVLPGDRGPLSFVVRTRVKQDAVLTDIRRAAATFSPGTIPSAVWWTDRISTLTAISNPRFQTLLLSCFAAIALGLTALGIFGVVAFLVVARSKEMGIRVAIGADPRSLVRLMVRQALGPVGVGLIFGLVATRWLTGFAEAQLYDVSTDDPATLAAASATVVLAALVAAYLPARRASRVDPLAVLRTE
jgi:hypothetical protein